MTHSFFDLYAPARPQQAGRLILDTREKIRPLLKQIQQIPGLTWDDTDVIQRVMCSIQYEHRALSQLHEDCMVLVGRATGIARGEMAAVPDGWQREVRQLSDECFASPQHPYPSEVPWLKEATAIANYLTELGAYLFTQLRSIGAYTNGYLHYQFQDWLDYDMVLVRFEPRDVSL